MTHIKNQLQREDLEKIVKGGCLLASGGGGTYTSGIHLASHFIPGDYYRHPEVKLVSKEEAIKEGGYACVVAYVGAPAKLDKVKYPIAPENAVRQIQRRLQSKGKNLKYLVPVECGALGLLVPCLLASKLDLRVIDGDGAGRAVPELPMLTFAAKGVSARPTILANDKGTWIDLEVATEDATHSDRKSQENAAEAIEQIVRPLIGVEEFDQYAGLAIWVMDSETLARALPIEGTLTRALKLGEYLSVTTRSVDQVVQYLREECHLKAYNMFTGVLTPRGVSTTTAGGFDHGTVMLQNERNNETAVSLFQNETLIAWNTAWSHPMAMAPDSIAYYIADDLQNVYSNGDIIQGGKLAKQLTGKSASLIGIAADETLRISEASLVSSLEFRHKMRSGEIMRSFKKVLAQIGYPGKYLKIEDIWEK